MAYAVCFLIGMLVGLLADAVPTWTVIAVVPMACIYLLGEFSERRKANGRVVK